MKELSTAYLARGIRLAKSIITGAVASAVDMALLVVLVEVFRVSPEMANLPSLVLGSAIQFWGNRHFVFGVTKSEGWQRQVILFTLIEIASIALNWLAFYFFIHSTSVHYAVLRPVIAAVVYIVFTYPPWGKIFRPRDLA